MKTYYDLLKCFHLHVESETLPCGNKYLAEPRPVLLQEFSQGFCFDTYNFSINFSRDVGSLTSIILIKYIWIYQTQATAETERMDYPDSHNLT